jgi:hypothetical protein
MMIWPAGSGIASRWELNYNKGLCPKTFGLLVLHADAGRQFSLQMKRDIEEDGMNR